MSTRAKDSSSSSSSSVEVRPLAARVHARQEAWQRLYNLVAHLAHPKGDHRTNEEEDEAHDLIRELRTETSDVAARVHALIAQWRERMQVIRQRADAATKGPWKAEATIDRKEPRCDGIHPDYHNHEGKNCYDYERPGYEACPSKDEIVTTDSGYYGPTLADAEFIAHAREDIPWLLDALEAALAAALAPHPARPKEE